MPQLSDDLETFGWLFIACLVLAMLLDLTWQLYGWRVRRRWQRWRLMRKWAPIKTLTELRELDQRRQARRRVYEAHGQE